MPSSVPRANPESLCMPFSGADSHAHLDDEHLLPRLEEILDRAVRSGLSFIVHVFLLHDRYTSHRGRILHAASALSPAPTLCFIRGLHPEDVLRADEEEWEHLVEAVRTDPLIRAVGEIGLDYHYDSADSPPDLQEWWFRRQIRLARDLNKPVVIHSRDAWEKTFSILEEEGMPGHPLLWHCFGGDTAQAARILENGWHIALGGAVTFGPNAATREAARIIPLDRLMFETDCPYLAPMPWRGKCNEPAFAVFTAARIAEEKGVDAAARGRMHGAFSGWESPDSLHEHF